MVDYTKIQGYLNNIEELETSVRKKSANIKFERKEKDYRKIHVRQKLMDSKIENSLLMKYMLNLLILLGEVVFSTLKIEDDALAKERENWSKYISEMLSRD